MPRANCFVCDFLRGLEYLWIPFDNFQNVCPFLICNNIGCCDGSKLISIIAEPDDWTYYLLFIIYIWILNLFLGYRRYKLEHEGFGVGRRLSSIFLEDAKYINPGAWPADTVNPLNALNI